MKSYVKKSITFIFIKCSYRNTLITITNADKKPLYQCSSRSDKSKVKKKNNPYILKKISFEIIQFLKKIKSRKLIIYLQGVGAGRYNIIKYLTKIKGIRLCLIEDRTRIPFNGCRLKKKKRK